MSKKEIIDRISVAFSRVLRVPKSRALQLLPPSMTSGKMYEAHVLSIICEELKYKEGCSLVLKNGSKIVLKTSGGGINRKYPWIEVWRNGKLIGEIFTDIHFVSMSYFLSKKASPPSPGEYHELDIVMTKAGVVNKPEYNDILIGVECKHTEYNKSLLKEALGVRREMGLLSESNKTIFSRWPSCSVPSNPASCFLVYSSSNKVAAYEAPGKIFGIEFNHETL